MISKGVGVGNELWVTTCTQEEGPFFPKTHVLKPWSLLVRLQLCALQPGLSCPASQSSPSVPWFCAGPDFHGDECLPVPALGLPVLNSCLLPKIQMRVASRRCPPRPQPPTVPVQLTPYLAGASLHAHPPTCYLFLGSGAVEWFRVQTRGRFLHLGPPQSSADRDEKGADLTLL